MRLYTVDPGEMDTRMHADALPSADRAELSDPARVAERIVALCAAGADAPASGSRVAIRVGPQGTGAVR